MRKTLRFSRWLACVLGICVLLSCPMLVLAQEDTATLHGTVADSDGAAVSGSHLSAILQGDSNAQPVTANSTGDYSFNGLAPGVYQIKVETAGFKTIVVTNLRLLAGDSQELKFTLQSGSPDEIISIDSGEQTPDPPVR